LGDKWCASGEIWNCVGDFGHGTWKMKPVLRRLD